MPRKPKGQVDVANSEVVKRSSYTQTLQKIIAEGHCPFCEENLFKHHTKPIILSGTYWLVTRNAWPYEGSRFHFLVICRSHIEKTEDIDSKAWAELQTLYRNLCQKYKLNGASLMIRSGDTRVTGASVNHLHAHIIVGAVRNANSEPIRALVGFQKK